MKLNEKIWVLRKKAGLSQEALAEKLGVSRQAVSKWETGEALPDIAKLPLLARTFSVTADWLLDDEADFEAEEEASAPDIQPEAETAPPVQAYPEWVEHLPGALGRMLKKYGWIFGLRMALSGALFAGMGMIGKAMFRTMANSFGMEMPGFSSGVTFYDEAGNMVNPSHFGLSAADLNAMGLGGPAGYGTIFDSASMTAPADLLCNFIIFIGLITLIGGAALAWYLKKKGQETM